MIIKNLIAYSSLLLCFLSCIKNKDTVTSKEDKTQDILVKLTPVEEKNIDLEILTHGLLSTDEDVKLSFKTSGIIKSMYAKEGDRISKGQILAQLDFTEINAQKMQVEESYNKAQREYIRANNLFKDSVITLENLENAKTALNVAKQNLDIINYNISHSLIKAPSNGVILQRKANEGEYINPGAIVYEISKETSKELIIKSYVSVHDWLNIQEGDKASIELDGFSNTKFEGRIKHISEHTDPSSGLYLIETQINQTPEKIVVGMFAKIHIQASKQQHYRTIPISSISGGDGNLAYVYIPNGKHVKKIEIEIAQIKGGLVYTYKGLDDIDQVINDGAGFLSEKSTISIKQ